MYPFLSKLFCILVAMDIMFLAMATTNSLSSSSSSSSSLISGVVTLAATCYILSTATSKAAFATSMPGPNRIILVSSLLASTLQFASPLEELHDLDYDQQGYEYENEGTKRNNDYDNGDNEQLLSTHAGKEKEKALDQLHRDVLDQDAHNDKLDQDNDDEYSHNNPNVMERFSRVIAKEIMRRLPWKGNKKWQQKKDFNNKGQPDLLTDKDSVDASNNDKVSITKGIDIQSERRVGAWCPPDADAAGDTDTAATASDSGVDVIVDKAVAMCSSSESSKSIQGSGSDTDSCSHAIEGGTESNSDDVQPGMVVYVFPQGKLDIMEQEPLVEDSDVATSLEMIGPDNNAEQDNGDDDNNAGDSNSDSSSTIHGTRCIVEMGQRYDVSEQVVQYTLLQQEPVELGNIDVHRKDFAYRPVGLTIDDGGNREPSRGINLGHELETRKNPKDEVLEALPSPQQSSWDDSGDQQVSFRWWSWVSQFLHQDKSYGGSERVDNEGTMNPDVIVNSIYEEAGERAFAGGSHGEIWRARRRCPMNDKATNTDSSSSSSHNKTSHCDDGKDLIVKRLKIEYGFGVLEAGLREVYFGELLAREVESSNLFTTYVDHFFREGAQNQVELWIVFENAGPSLRSFLYTPIDTAGFMMYTHSQFWRRLRKGISGGKQFKGYKEDESLVVATPILYPDHNEDSDHKRDAPGKDNTKKPESGAADGRVLLREVLRQLISAVAFLHERGIVHRDIKPSNVMCKTTPPTVEGIIPRKIEVVRCILGDFSSAWNDFADRNLYTKGPSSKEQTDEYAPPEVLFQGPSWSPFFHENPFSYDMWSIGVVALEILLGTPNVFSVDQRTTALLTNRLKKEGASSHDIQKALYLAALAALCIYVPTESKNWPLRRGDPLQYAKVVKHKCTLQDFHSALRARDPLGTGFDDDANQLLHLVWRLLGWNPSGRLSASDALKHPYFSSQSDINQDWKPNFLHNHQILEPVVVHGLHNALEHQTLDPKVDIASDTAMISEYICPKCGKIFNDHNSCQQHARSRRHAQFCIYDRSLLPQCLNAHSMLPTHPTSGYCDVQGRRKTIEDFHTVHLNPDHQFYGVFDGHLGNLASKYAASFFYGKVSSCLSNVNESIQFSQSKWKEDTTAKLIQSFEDLHNGIISAVTSSPGGVMDASGTTATILYVTELAVIVANVGDSRAIMSQWLVGANGNEQMSVVQLTVDHVASSKKEQMQILERGGFISESGGIDRVNGSLAVSRSLGDIKLAKFLSRTPHVFAMTKEEARDICGERKAGKKQTLPCFVILASDGLWDVMSNQEAVDLAWQVIKGNQSGTAYQEAAEVLTQEAYVRGSSDNIGVCIVAIM